MNSKILFFEGPPGAGKSTLSEYVAEQMRLQGLSVCWIEEHLLEDNYLSAFMSAPRETAIEALLNGWKKLAVETMASESVYVVDGAFFGNSIKFLLGNGATIEEIDRAQTSLYEIFAPTTPCVVYLNGSVSESMARAVGERGQTWATHIATEVNKYHYQEARQRCGIGGMVEFFVDSYVLFERLLQTCPFNQIRIDTEAGDWKSLQSKLLLALGLTEVELPAALQVDPKPYIGKYNTPNYFPEQFNRPLYVDADGEGLLLHVWFHANFRLVPESTTVFHIRSKPWQVEFILDKDGQAEALVYPFVPKRHLCVRAKHDSTHQWD